MANVVDETLKYHCTVHQSCPDVQVRVWFQAWINVHASWTERRNRRSIALWTVARIEATNKTTRNYATVQRRLVSKLMGSLANKNEVACAIICMKDSYGPLRTRLRNALLASSRKGFMMLCVLGLLEISRLLAPFMNS